MPGSAGRTVRSDELRAPALVDLVAARDEHGASARAQLGHAGDVVPDHRRDAAGAVGEHEAQDLPAAAAAADLRLPDEEDELHVLPVFELPHLHGREGDSGSGRHRRDHGMARHGPWVGARGTALTARRRTASGRWMTSRDCGTIVHAVRTARLHVLLAALCFGTTGTAQALGPDASPQTVGALRILAGAALLLLVARVVRAPRPPAGAALAVAALGVAGYQLCFFAAVRDTGSAVGTVVALGSAPASRALGGWLLDRRAPGRAWAIATALAALGVALLALAGADAEVSAPGRRPRGRRGRVVRGLHARLQAPAGRRRHRRVGDGVGVHRRSGAAPPGARALRPGLGGERRRHRDDPVARRHPDGAGLPALRARPAPPPRRARWRR